MRGGRPTFLVLTFVMAAGIGVGTAHADPIIPVRALYLLRSPAHLLPRTADGGSSGTRK